MAFARYVITFRVSIRVASPNLGRLYRGCITMMCILNGFLGIYRTLPEYADCAEHVHPYFSRSEAYWKRTSAVLDISALLIYNLDFIGRILNTDC